MTDIKIQFDPNLRKSISNKKQVAVIPVGSIEQHGAHLPVSTDSDIVTEVSKKISEKYGYKPYGEKHGESKFTKWFQDIYLPQYHGIDKRKAHLSSMILSKQLTRTEALKELEKPVAEYMGGGKKHCDYKQGEKWWLLASKIYAYFK